MKAFLLAMLALIVIGYGASVVLEGYQQTVDSSFVGSGARPDPEPSLRGLPKPKS